MRIPFTEVWQRTASASAVCNLNRCREYTQFNGRFDCGRLLVGVHCIKEALALVAAS
jgi:hypothetical protein